MTLQRRVDDHNPDGLTDHERILLTETVVAEHHTRETGVHPGLEDRVRSVEDFQRDIRTAVNLAKWALGVGLLSNAVWIVEAIRTWQR